MSWFVEHWIASSLLVIYVSVLFYNAYVGNKAATGVGGYYVGNRQLGGTVVGISFLRRLPRPTPLLDMRAKATTTVWRGSPWPFCSSSSPGCPGGG